MKAPAPDSRRPVVLMVDDEAVSRTLLEHCLTKTGHRAVVAESAAAAWRRFAEFGPGSFDCLVTDGKMPGESGLELLLWLKQKDPTLSVVMVPRRRSGSRWQRCCAAARVIFGTSRSRRRS